LTCLRGHVIIKQLLILTIHRWLYSQIYFSFTNTPQTRYTPSLHTHIYGIDLDDLVQSRFSDGTIYVQNSEKEDIVI